MARIISPHGNQLTILPIGEYDIIYDRHNINNPTGVGMDVVIRPPPGAGNIDYIIAAHIELPDGSIYLLPYRYSNLGGGVFVELYEEIATGVHINMDSYGGESLQAGMYVCRIIYSYLPYP